MVYLTAIGKSRLKTAFPVGNENRRKIVYIYLDENIQNLKNPRKEWIGQRSIERHLFISSSPKLIDAELWAVYPPHNS